MKAPYPVFSGISSLISKEIIYIDSHVKNINRGLFFLLNRYLFYILIFVTKPVLDCEYGTNYIGGHKDIKEFLPLRYGNKKSKLSYCSCHSGVLKMYLNIYTQHPEKKGRL